MIIQYSSNVFFEKAMKLSSWKHIEQNKGSASKELSNRQELFCSCFNKKKDVTVTWKSIDISCFNECMNYNDFKNLKFTTLVSLQSTTEI